MSRGRRRQKKENEHFKNNKLLFYCHGVLLCDMENTERCVLDHAARMRFIKCVYLPVMLRLPFSFE